MRKEEGTNPKDLVGSKKNPHCCVSQAVMAEVGVGMMEGSRKYGRHNYRAVKVRASVYYDAARRHIDAWWEGEDFDSDSGVHHVSKAIACLTVVRDAEIQGMMVDDRPPKTPDWHKKHIAELVEKVLKKIPESIPPYTARSVKEKKKMICFLDLDGVLIDFMKGAHEFHKLPYSTDDYPYEFGEWANCPPDNANMTNEEFWGTLDEDFWANLTWLKDGIELLHLIEEAFGQDNICLLTTPTLSPRSVSGKLRWIQEHLHRYSRQFLIGPPKSFCAHDRAVLIDDRDKNVEYFMDCGGYGILVPRPWNSLFRSRDKSLAIVRDKLKELKESDIWKV